MRKNDDFWPYSFDIPKMIPQIIVTDRNEIGLSGYSGTSGNVGLSGKSGVSGHGITGFGGTSIVPSFITLSEKIQLLNKKAILS